MLRYAFTMKLKPGAYAEYRHLHDTIWPELVEEIERCGVVTMSIFEAGPELLFLYSEVRDEERGPASGAPRRISGGAGRSSTSSC